MFYKLSFNCADFVKASKGALKLSFERLVTLKDLPRIVFLGLFFLSQVVSHRGFEPREGVTL